MWAALVIIADPFTTRTDTTMPAFLALDPPHAPLPSWDPITRTATSMTRIDDPHPAPLLHYDFWMLYG